MSNNTLPYGFSIATARKVTPLRQRMIDDMTVRNFAPNTMLCYLKQVTYFAQHFGRSPDRLGPEEIRSYQIYLAKERKVGISSRKPDRGGQRPSVSLPRHFEAGSGHRNDPVPQARIPAA